jgi:Protein of unknown function (DUF3995)
MVAGWRGACGWVTYPGPMTSASERPAGPTWPAYAAFWVALLYAAVSFYWAFGGTVGVDTLGGRLEELAREGDPAVLWLSGVAGVLKVAGAVVALALVRPWGRVVPRRLLLVLAWGGAVVLVAYGGLYVVGGALALAGVVEGAGAEDRVALWWRVLVWDLWFLVWGVLLGLAARSFGRGLSAADPGAAGGLRGGG